MIKNLLKYYELFDSEPDDIITEYIQLCPIYTITSEEFKEKFGNHSPEEAKRLALRNFNELVLGYAKDLGIRAKYGFSDDDPKFVKAAIDEFIDLKRKNKNLDYSVFDTGGNKKIKKVF